MKLVVGLGNPGARYRNTRHNVGFMVIDLLARRYGAVINKRRFHSYYTVATVNSTDVVLVKPHTYMNVSGEAVARFIASYGIAISDIIVILDDVQLPFGKIRIRTKGTAGGHNGLHSIVSCLNTPDFTRLRVGIDRPPAGTTLTDYVLQDFTAAEREQMGAVTESASAACALWLAEGSEAAMQRYN